MDAIFYATPTENPIVTLDGVVMQNSLKCKKYAKSNAHQQKPGKTGWLGQNVGLQIHRKANPMLPTDDAR